MIRIENAATLTEYFSHVRDIRTTWNPTRSNPEEIWFRGHSRRSYKLLPGLCRDDARDAGYEEEDLLERFKVLAAIHLDPRPGSEWEWYFVAQHYGLPTRLLDWTESALSAAFFAVAHEIARKGRRAVHAEQQAPPQAEIFDEASPCVWMLDAGTLNSAAFGEGSDHLLTPGGKRTEHYSPAVEVGGTPVEFEWGGRVVSNRAPIALLPQRQTPRIVSQQGTFTVHGVDPTPIDQLVGCTESDEIRLAVILFDRANLSHLWDEIETTGISRLILFPELANVAEYLKWVCQKTD